MSAASLILSQLIELLTKAQRQSDDSAVLRDIVRDNAQPMHKLVGPSTETKVTVVGAQQVEDRRAGDVRTLDALMQIEDQRWRAQRKRELGG